MGCLACGEPRFDGPGKRLNADDFVCRACQKSPPIQMRVHLNRARKFGMTWEAAWLWSLERIRWPHDTAERREWKELLEQESMRGAWRCAYGREGRPRKHLAGMLDMAA